MKRLFGKQKDWIFPWHQNLVDDPITLSEHLVHKMHNDRNPLLIQLEDKYASREYVEKNSDCKLPKLYHFLERGSEKIPWNDLPERCVLKANHWSGDSLFILDNAPEPIPNVPRAKLPMIRSKKQHGYYIIRNGRDQYGRFWPRWRIQAKLSGVLEKDFPVSLEWGAYNISPRGIIIEEFLMGDDGGPPVDIKMHCFGGKVGYIQFEHGRFGSEILQNIHLPDGSLIDTKGEQTKWFNDTSVGNLREHLGTEIVDRLIQVSEQLSKDTMYVRVDLFIINSEVVFGEFTNYPRSAQPQAPQWEKLGGEKWREARGAPKIEEAES